VQKENEGCCFGGHFLGFRGMKEEGEDVVSANMSEREVRCERR
jgi:hypothetical protein